MKTHAKTVIIGGGAMGVSLLYHLVKQGWTDVVLIEKNELTAGSTWHAAGLCTHYAHNPTIMEMRATSVRLYKDILPKETGLPTGFHQCGALRITRSADRMDEFRHVQGLGKFVGYDFNILTPDELKEIYPLVELDGIIGAIHEPYDGYVDPTMAVTAMAKAARDGGAEIYRQTCVTRIEPSASGEWQITTDKGTISAEHIVNAAGTWCREIGEMMGMDLPVVPMLHQYLVTEGVSAVQKRIHANEPELPMIRDPEESWYIRQERDGLILGPYEKDAVTWSIDGVPPEFGMELLPPDLDRVSHIIEHAMERVPAVGSAGIKTVVNGPITFTPDANPLIGPAYNLPNAWLLTGSSMGVMEGGGAGAFLANWMVSGAPQSDAWAIDSRRFGGYADRDYRIQKAVECFGLQFGVHYPYEERPAARNKRQSPLYNELAKAGAQFGTAYGWERPIYFGPETPLTFRPPEWLDNVRNECLAVQSGCGITDLSAFSKFEIQGPGAFGFISSLGANTAPKTDGKIGLIHALTPNGGTASEFTVTRIDKNHFYLTSAAFAQRHDFDLLNNRASGNISITDKTDEIGIIGFMGPAAFEKLYYLTPDALDFPWLSAKQITVAGISVRALRVSYIGEAGLELHVKMQDMKPLYDALMELGDIAHFGAFAMDSMRLEKGYCAMGSDLTTERTPSESSLGYLVKTEGRDFAGKDQMILRDQSKPWRMVLLDIDKSETVKPYYAHTVYQEGIPVGIITSAAYGFRTGKSLALAYLRPEATARKFQIGVLSERLNATILPTAPYDPENNILKGQL